MSRADIAIIGSGPAGVSAAITAKVRKKNIILYGEKTISDKVKKAHKILNYPGLPEVSGSEFSQRLYDHLRQMDIEITEKKVTMVYAMGDYYILQTSDGQMQEATTVILASGMIHEKPLPGEDEFLGRGVSYCVTCDAMFYREKTAAVIGYNREAEEEADFLADVADKVYYIPMYQEEPDLKKTITVLREKPLKMFGDMQIQGLSTEDRDIPLDGVFLIRDAIAPAKLVPGLAMDSNHVKVNLKMETNLSGLYACGDIAGTPYQYVKAAGQGNVAALSAVSYLDTKKKKNG